jgi:thiamine biosynthesis protein ThiS
MIQSIDIRLNGKPCAVRLGSTVAELVHEHALDPAGVAVSINGAVIRRTSYTSECLTEHDDVRFIRAIAGG